MTNDTVCEKPLISLYDNAASRFNLFILDFKRKYIDETDAKESDKIIDHENISLLFD